MKKYLIALVVLLAVPCFATTYYVNASTGSSSNTCTQAQSTSTPKDTIAHGIACMGTADTVVVYAGTYSESPTITAGGGSGSYNTVTVHGTDTVSVLGWTMNSHTQLIGNCPTKQGTVTTASCGFFVSNTSSPSSACVSLPGSTTDVYIRNNVMYACGSIGPGYPTQTSYIYVQGNTISYTDSTVATVPTTCQGAGSPVGNSLNLYGNHYLVENNDFSHYTLSLNWNPEYSIARNNLFHDTVEVNNAGNCHSDTWFSDPGGTNLVTNSFNVFEGNYQYNAQGANAKGTLFQVGGTCTGCAYGIVRFNITNRLGSGVTTNDENWVSVKVYNNTNGDPNYDSDRGSSQTVESDNSYDSSPPASSYLNQIYYYSFAIGGFGTNPYTCATSQCNYGHSLYYCPSGCSPVYSHTYESGSWTSDSGNISGDPKFTNYISAGNASNDYHLKSGSPAIAAGTYLTTVASGDAGTGTTLTLTDSSYFQDGYGLSNAYSTVSGDCISVTTVTNHICITAVNYSGNTVTLASGITRSVGDHVWLYSKSDGTQVLTGTAPDMGALPFTSSTLTPPTNIQVIEKPGHLAGLLWDVIPNLQSWGIPVGF